MSPQRAGVPPSMLRGRMTGYPKKTGGPGTQRDRIRWIQFAQSHLTVAHQPRVCLMCSGSSLHVECILPFGMLCLSAWRMMYVKMVFAVCMSGGG